MLPRVTVLKIIVFQQSFISRGILICVWVTMTNYSPAFQYYWLHYQTRIWVILMILTYIAYIYPMKGFLELFLERLFFFQEVRVNKFALI